MLQATYFFSVGVIQNMCISSIWGKGMLCEKKCVRSVPSPVTLYSLLKKAR